jgi:hypothetical protein
MKLLPPGNMNDIANDTEGSTNNLHCGITAVKSNYLIAARTLQKRESIAIQAISNG